MRGRKTRAAGAGLNPPTFNASKTISSRYRFESSSALVKVQITAEAVLDLLCMATGTTAAYQLCSSARVKSVKIWGPMASDLKPVTVAVEYVAYQGGGTTGSPTSRMSDTSMGSARAASVSFPPPPGSLASLWLSSVTAATPIFQLDGPANSVIDLVLEQQIRNDEGPQAVHTTVAGATVGTVYVRALDSDGSSLIVPVSYPTI